MATMLVFAIQLSILSRKSSLRLGGRMGGGLLHRRRFFWSQELTKKNLGDALRRRGKCYLLGHFGLRP